VLGSIDPSRYREVTEALVPARVGCDPELLNRLLTLLSGVGYAEPCSIHGLAVHKHHPSGLLIHENVRNGCRAWAPVELQDKAIGDWRREMEVAIKPAGVEMCPHGLMCATPINHRWVFERSNFVLHPLPADSPRAPMLMAEHPCVLQCRLTTYSHRVTTATFATREIERLVLLLNAVTYLRCEASLRMRQGWAWDRSRDKHARWMDIGYDFMALHDKPAMQAVERDTLAGKWMSDLEYYGREASTIDDGATFPSSADETIAAALAFKDDDLRTVLKASRLIAAADEAAASTVSLAYAGLVFAIEAVSNHWQPAITPTKRFSMVLETFLPPTEHLKPMAKRLYQLRNKLVHAGSVFSDDWISLFPGSDPQQWSAMFSVARVSRLILINWIRSMASLPMVLNPDVKGPYRSSE